MYVGSAFNTDALTAQIVVDETAAWWDNYEREAVRHLIL